MLARLKAARLDQPTAAALEPAVRQVTRQVANRVAAAGGSARITVEAGATRLSVRAHGPAAGQALAMTREGLARGRQSMREAVRAEAQRKLRGTGR